MILCRLVGSDTGEFDLLQTECDLSAFVRIEVRISVPGCLHVLVTKTFRYGQNVESHLYQQGSV